MIKNFINKILNKDKKERFLYHLTRLQEKYGFYIVPVITIFKDNKEITDKMEESLIAKKINKWLKKERLGISCKIVIIDKNQLNPENNGKDTK